MTRFRFTPGDFEHMNRRPVDEKCAEAAGLANAKLDEWESESERIYAAENPETKKLSGWTAKGPVKLKASDYTHVACVWNPKSFKEKK
jgi:hypothetical protein